YGQFCPVAKTAEVFGDRWSPLIVRELCFGTKTFGEFLQAMPLISRTVLAQRLRELAHAGVLRIDPKEKGRGHLYRLTAAGEDFRPLIAMMSQWGQRWGQGLIGRDDLNPQLLLWGLRRQIDPADIPSRGLVIRFEFSGIPPASRKLRYWWLWLRPEDVEVCVRDPGRSVDVAIVADLGVFTRVWMGYAGLRDALASGHIALHGSKRSIADARRVLRLPGQPELKNFAFPASAPLADAGA
ncbi:MAG: winged helix-turn-helix transcriptional regulator, partial [Gammaproteobacteria bacterium]